MSGQWGLQVTVALSGIIKWPRALSYARPWNGAGKIPGALNWSLRPSRLANTSGSDRSEEATWDLGFWGPLVVPVAKSDSLKYRRTHREAEIPGTLIPAG